MFHVDPMMLLARKTDRVCFWFRRARDKRRVEFKALSGHTVNPGFGDVLKLKETMCNARGVSEFGPENDPRFWVEINTFYKRLLAFWP